VQLHVLASPPALPAGTARVFVHPAPALLPAFGLSASMWRHLRAHASAGHIVHTHSLWSLPATAPVWAPRGAECRYVISPRGTLSACALRRSRWKKRIAWRLGQARALRAADCLHATADNEADDFRRLGLRAPIAIVPNGIDIPELQRSVASVRDRTVLYLGRLHPIKGIDLLLLAWARLEARHPLWRLVLAGDDATAPGYRRTLERQAKDLGLSRAHFVGAVHGTAKRALLFGGDAFVLPSHSENFGNVVAEALAHGVPAVASTNTPWPGLRTERCGWWIDNNAETLSACLDAVMRSSPPELAAMGARGRAWMARDFGWPSVARRMEAVYLWLLGRQARPPCVHLS
jgi:glycosyltransferase involved in cell wall biosynthesis